MKRVSKARKVEVCREEQGSVGEEEEERGEEGEEEAEKIFEYA